MYLVVVDEAVEICLVFSGVVACPRDVGPRLLRCVLMIEVAVVSSFYLPLVVNLILLFKFHLP